MSVGCSIMPQYELNIRDYWQILQKRRPFIIAIFFFVLIPVVIYTNLQTPVYQTSASVQWVGQKTIGGLLTDIVSIRSGDPLATEARIIMSLPILEKVVVELGLAANDAGGSEVIRKARALQAAVSTNVINDTNIIRITVTYTNPQMTANIANKIAEVYIAENLNAKTKESRQVREFIEKQLEEISGKLKSSEEALAKFKETTDITGQAVPLQNKLMELISQRQNLLQFYTSEHPDVKGIDEQIVQLKGQLKKIPLKELIFIRLTREAEINGKLYHALKDKLETARIAEVEKSEDASLVDKAPIPDSPVRPNKPLNYLMGAIIGLMLSFAGAFIVEQLDTSIGTIEDVENYFKLPALGVIPYLRTKSEKDTGFIQSVLGKKFKEKDKLSRLKEQLLLHYSGSSPVFEAYRMLRTNIQAEVFKDKTQGKILLFSSAVPSEGKSITSANLAITMAQGGFRTLLIDADMRISIIHNIFGLKEKGLGLSDVLRGTINFKDAIRTVTDMLMGDLGFDNALNVPGLDNLNILTSGSLSTTPAELLSSMEMDKLLEKLREAFDFILIDSPPVLAVADALILAPKADGAALVYRVGKTSRSILARAKTQLVESGAKVKGIVLNNISPVIEMRYGYYYHYKSYGKYYEEKKEGA